jgi:hypothetical protein
MRQSRKKLCLNDYPLESLKLNFIIFGINLLLPKNKTLHKA